MKLNFSPPLLITNTDSGLMHAIKMSGEVYRGPSTSSTMIKVGDRN